MIVLGINGGFGGGYQDACAALMIDGQLTAALEEERLSGIKFSPGVVPVLSIDAILKAASLGMDRVDVLAFHGASWPDDIEDRLRAFFLHHWGHCPAIERHYHHDAHAASAFYASGWDEALILTMDNSGDGISTQIMTGHNGQGLRLLRQFARPQSLGTFYGTLTQLAGFRRDADEYKLMGLAAYGDASSIDLGFMLEADSGGGYRLDTQWIRGIEPGRPFPQKQIPLYSDALRKRLLGTSHPGMLTGSKGLRADLAAAAQQRLEEVVCGMIRHWIGTTGLRKVCLAGGVALNCAMNRRILEMDEVEALFIPPYAGDQGISVGAAMLSTAARGVGIAPPTTPYTGLEYTTDTIESVLRNCGAPYRKAEDIAGDAAALLHEGKIIAWHQGRSEIGPRALGNRSILASPLAGGMKDAINRRIKFREGFRPFCPSVLVGDATRYFDMTAPAYAFMNLNALVLPETQKQFPDITHADGTARLQTVTGAANPRFHSLLTRFKALSGHGMVINTSFNVRNHPMAEHPARALECFFSSGLDALCIGDYLVQKSP